MERIRVKVRMGYEEVPVEVPKGSTLKDLLQVLSRSFHGAEEFFEGERGELFPDCQVLLNGQPNKLDTG